VVPQSAILLDQAGRYVLVVNAGSKVEPRRVTTAIEEGRNVVVTDGLNEGEQVIVEGIQKVHPGQIVAASGVPGPSHVFSSNYPSMCATRRARCSRSWTIRRLRRITTERNLRPTARYRKVTGGFRSTWGADRYAAVRSTVATAAKQRIHEARCLR